MTPYVDDPDFTLYHGDAVDVLRGLPDGCVDMVVTSPPFYGLRDYGVDGQIGLEESPDVWVDRLVAVFRECRRVLADHGTLWVEIGDSYTSGQGGRQSAAGEMPARPLSRDHAHDIGRDVGAGGWKSGAATTMTPARGTTDLKPKDLLGQPWLLAFALRADGWYLRSEIIWHRPNPMPESVTDRPTKAHSTVFLLSKRPRYFYDADAIREAWADSRNGNPGNFTPRKETDGFNGKPRYATSAPANSVPNVPQSETLDGSHGESPRGPDGRRATMHTGKGDNSAQPRSENDRWPNPSGANARSVWTIPTQATPFAHFATWPEKLAERMILAGTSEAGRCRECGKPWERTTATSYENPGNRTTNGTGRRDRRDEGVRVMAANVRLEKRVETTGWAPTCDHPGDPEPCVVLDPFMGSGTTALVARRLERRSIGIELNVEYCRLAAERMGQQSLLAEVSA